MATGIGLLSLSKLLSESFKQGSLRVAGGPGSAVQGARHEAEVTVTADASMNHYKHVDGNHSEYDFLTDVTHMYRTLVIFHLG